MRVRAMSFRPSDRPGELRRNDNPALHGAYQKGLRARRRGEPVTACPYLGDGPGKGWRRAFRIAWEKGWNDGAPPVPHEEKGGLACGTCRRRERPGEQFLRLGAGFICPGCAEDEDLLDEEE